MKRLLLITLLLAACGAPKEEADMRIISLMPSNTEIIYALGAGDDVVGVTTVDDYPKEALTKEKFDNFNLSKEALLKAKPDIIFAHESAKAQQEKVLASLDGVKVVYVKDAKTVAEIDETIEQIADALHKEKQADKVIDKMHSEIEQVVKKYPGHGQKVFFEVSSEPEIYTSGRGTFFDDMLHELGARNAFSNIEGWQAVSKEAIVKANPDVIIGTTGASDAQFDALVEKRSGFKAVTAVKNDAVEAVDADKISRPGPRIAEGLKELAEAIND